MLIMLAHTEFKFKGKLIFELQEWNEDEQVYQCILNTMYLLQVILSHQRLHHLRQNQRCKWPEKYNDILNLMQWIQYSIICDTYGPNGIFKVMKM